MQNKKNIFFILSVLSSSSLLGATPHQHRQLIAIIDVINGDFEQVKTYFDDKVIIPGPVGGILCNVCRNKVAPTIVTKNVFQVFYNFCIFSNHMMTKDISFLESKYGTIVNSTESNPISLEKLHAIVTFLWNQYKEGKQFINETLNTSSLNPTEIATKTLEYLDKKGIGSPHFNQLIKELKIPLNVKHLALKILEYFKAFSLREWSIYTSEHGNYILIPKGYPADIFSKKYLYPIKPKEKKHNSKSLGNETVASYEGKLFVTDVQNFINGISFQERKPLDFFLIGHGLLPFKNMKVSGGLLAKDQQRLITALGQANTRSFFYITCHGGGLTAKNLWFGEKEISEYQADALYQVPFVTIISPTTELPFNIRLPYWIDTCMFIAQHPQVETSFIQKDIPPCQGLPDLKKYFEEIPFSLTTALKKGLFNPLAISLHEHRSTIVSQAALIKLPGTDWFSAHYLNEGVFNISKTKVARAVVEKKPLIQPVSKKIITISSPLVYAPLVIHQTNDLRIVPLLPEDPGYQQTQNKYTTFLETLIIQNSDATSPQEILSQLATSNIGPCTILSGIPLNLDSKDLSIDRNFVINQIIGPNKTILARSFTITRHGTFFINDKNKLVYFKNDDPQTIVESSNSLKILFEKVHETIAQQKKQDNEATLAKRSIQAISQKIRAMNNINIVLQKRMETMNKGKK